MIRAELVVPDSDRWKVRGRAAMERSGVLASLEATLDGLNPDWRDYPSDIGVLSSVRTPDVTVAMVAFCDATGPRLGHEVRPELER